jgi:hypothetical protein
VKRISPAIVLTQIYVALSIVGSQHVAYAVQRMTTLLIRRLWTMYKKLLTDDGATKQELLFAHDAFYSGARSVLKVLAHMLEHGELDELHRTIQRHGRQIDVIQRSGRTAKRH